MPRSAITLLPLKALFLGLIVASVGCSACRYPCHLNGSPGCQTECGQACHQPCEMPCHDCAAGRRCGLGSCRGLRTWLARRGPQEGPPPELPPPAELHPVPTTPVFGCQLSGREAGLAGEPIFASPRVLEPGASSSLKAKEPPAREVFLNPVPQPTAIRRTSYLAEPRGHSEIRFAR